MTLDLSSLIDPRAVADRALMGLNSLEEEVLLGLCLEETGACLPLTRDGRLARDAFGDHLVLEMVGTTRTGARMRVPSHPCLDRDGAPTASVYRALAFMGLVRDSGGRCAWVPTSTGRAVAAEL